jgi:hypothetical protein
MSQRSYRNYSSIGDLQRYPVTRPARIFEELFIRYLGAMGIRQCIDKLARGDGSSLSGAVARFFISGMSKC